MSRLIKGIASFPSLFTAKVAKGATEAKYSIGVLIPPNDPQVPVILAEVESAKQVTYPSGYTGKDECFGLYDTKYAGKEYYDPRFTGWYIFTCSAKEHDRPSVVDGALTPIIDPSTVYSGMVVQVHAGISGYTKGRGGVGGWLNGVMITNEEPPMGRLDGRPSVEQMFAGVGESQSTPTLLMTAAANGVTYEQYMATPGWTDQMLIDQGLATAAAPAAPAAPATLLMTAAANGVTYEQYMATPGWTDQMLIDQGLAIRPSFG